ncbi:hypothetical protein [Sorangium sp. So ce1335]|uniref:hypothetical protein n=1 Tax=Sorangium sp. So ce1335 TaxID=3133335 RepID=UPI003F5EB439
MITKQLKSLLMIPSPNALRPRSSALPQEAAAGARAPADVAGAARQEPPAPRDPGEAPRPSGAPVPGRAPAVPSYLRDAPVASGSEPAAKPADPISLVPPGMRGFGDLRGTQPTSGAASTAPVLPFGPPAPPVPATRAAEAAVVPRGMRHFTSLTGTHPTSGAPAAAVLPFSSAARATPAAPSSPPSAPALSLEQYASLCAELAVAPGDAEALFARYGLDRPDARLAVDRFWRDRLARDEAAHRRWQELYWQHRTRCSAAGNSPHEPR